MPRARCRGTSATTPTPSTRILVLNVAACVQWLSERVETVVLLGNCGGGSLMGLYQSQAELPPPPSGSDGLRADGGPFSATRRSRQPAGW